MGTGLVSDPVAAMQAQKVGGAGTVSGPVLQVGTSEIHMCRPVCQPVCYHKTVEAFSNSKTVTGKRTFLYTACHNCTLLDGKGFTDLSGGPAPLARQRKCGLIMSATVSPGFCKIRSTADSTELRRRLLTA